MFDYQRTVFEWVCTQTWYTAFILMAAGLAYAFQGHRLFTFLLAVSSAAFGWAGGWVIGICLNTPPALPALIGGSVLTLLSLYRPRLTVLIDCGGTWLILGHYLAMTIGLPGLAAISLAVVAGGLGSLFAHLCYRSMTVLLTALQGSVLIMIGWVGLSTQFIPSVGHSFRDWAYSSGALVPILLVMLGITAYSIQASAKRGNMLTGNL